jgi:hypothetical protein
MFSILLTTIHDFVELFPSSLYMSGFIQWIVQLLSQFCRVYIKKVLKNTNLNDCTICLKKLFDHCSQVEKNGFTINFYLYKLLINEIERIAIKYCNEKIINLNR